MQGKAHVMSIVGARPQFIKLAVVAPRLAENFSHTLIHSGQHFDNEMSEIFFEQLQLPKVDHYLGVKGGSHGKSTGRMLARIEQVLLDQQPDLVVVYGDTNTTLAGALAAAKLHIPIAHVEAGLRSFVRSMPEEINRVLTDDLSSLLFCPTSNAISNLKREGISDGVVESGDVMYELLSMTRQGLKDNTALFESFNVKRRQFYLLTVHRAHNVDDPQRLKQLVEILESVDRTVIFPSHPRTTARLRKQRLLKNIDALENVIRCEPLGYRDLLTLAMHARAVLTDSGGLQKEAVFLKTPVLTLRNETEWRETLRLGNRLVDLDPQRITKALFELPEAKGVEWKVDGKKPSHIIARSIEQFLKAR